MDDLSRNRLSALVLTEENALTTDDKAFLKARSGYLSEEQKALFPGLFAETEKLIVDPVIAEENYQNAILALENFRKELIELESEEKPTDKRKLNALERRIAAKKEQIASAENDIEMLRKIAEESSLT